TPRPVQLGISAPRAIAPAAEFTARFVAHTKSVTTAIRRILRMLSPRSANLLGIATTRWARDTCVRVEAHCRHVKFRNPVQEFQWRADHVILDFDAQVDRNAPEATVVLKFDVSIERIVVATLRCDLEIAAVTRRSSKQTVHGVPARTAFASYSSEDRLRVL